jgi:hypothetical protein
MEPEDLFKPGTGANGESQESPLKSLETDLIMYSDSIREISDEIIENQVSLYPVFIAHQHEVAIGELILDKNDFGTEWNIHVSTVEEFVEAGIIDRHKQKFFVDKYKDPKKFMCLFVVVPEGANFVFYPYK